MRTAWKARVKGKPPFHLRLVCLMRSQVVASHTRRVRSSPTVANSLRSGCMARPHSSPRGWICFVCVCVIYVHSSTVFMYACVHAHVFVCEQSYTCRHMCTAVVSGDEAAAMDVQAVLYRHFEDLTRLRPRTHSLLRSHITNTHTTTTTTDAKK